MKPPDTFECHRLRAKITERQCKLNREGYRSRGINFPSITSCQGCAGLGESAQVPAPTEIPTMKKKKIECSHHGCGYGVKKEGDRCKKHQEPESGAGPVIHDVNNLDVKPAAKTVISDNIAPAIEPLHFAADGVYLTACGVVSSSSTLLTTNWDAVTCEHCLVWKPAVEQGADLDQISADSFEAEWVRNDELAQAMLGLIGCTVGLELLSDQPDDQIRAAMDYAGACHLQASDNDDVQIPPMPFFLQGTQTYAPEAQNQPVAATPPPRAGNRLAWSQFSARCLGGDAGTARPSLAGYRYSARPRPDVRDVGRPGRRHRHHSGAARRAVHQQHV